MRQKKRNRGYHSWERRFVIEQLLRYEEISRKTYPVDITNMGVRQQIRIDAFQGF